MAGTLTDMLDRIQDEIQRTDLDSQMQLAVTQSINYFQNDAFYVSDKTATQGTTIGVNNYTLPSDFAWARQIFITVNNTIYPLRPVTYEFLQSENDNALQPTQGSPIDYAIFNNTLFMYPTPDQSTYVITYDYVSQIPAPATPTTQGNFWMTTAEPIIRNWAKYLIYTEILQQTDVGQIFHDRAMDEHYKLRELTAQRKWTGTVRPWNL